MKKNLLKIILSVVALLAFIVPISVSADSGWVPPSQVGHNGQFLQTNGINTLWAIPGGGASITGSGTANQVSYFTGTHTIGSDASLTYTANSGILGVSKIIGGSAVGSNLSLQSTSGVGTTDFIKFLTGNNGGTEAMRIIDSGNVGINKTAPTFSLDVGSTKSKSSAVFTGSGLNDATSGGTYTGVNSGVYVVKIDNVAGVVKTISHTPTAAGTGYNNHDILTVTTGGANALVQVAAVGGTGNITSVNLISSGTGYSTGTGQATSGGYGTGATINIISVNTNNTFNYTYAGTTIASAVPIISGANALINGVTITFGALTGHTVNDLWTITATTTGVVNIGTTAYNIGGNFFGTEDSSGSVYLGSPSVNLGLSSNNVFLGKNIGGSNTDGYNNVFVGQGAGTNNTSGFDNVFVGQGAGTNNTIGYGLGSNLAGQVGYGNVFVGQVAGTRNTAGYGNVFVGLNSGSFNTIGFNSVFVGNQAGGANTTGDDNVFLGTYAGKINTIGNQNVMIGTLSGQANTTGGANVFVGQGAGQTNSTGSNNVFLGFYAGDGTTTGTGNFFGGYTAGNDTTTGIDLVAIGNSTRTGNFSNSIALGKSATITADNQFVVGQTATPVNKWKVAGVDWIMPAVQGAASTFLKNDGSGNLSWTASTATTPGGSNTQLQYNNSSAFGGISGATSDGTNIFIPTLYGGTAPAGNLLLSSTTDAIKGYVGLTDLGTATSNYGSLSIGSGGFSGSAGNFAGSVNGTKLAVNAASGFTGDLLDLQTNGNSYLKVSGIGAITTTPATQASGVSGFTQTYTMPSVISGNTFADLYSITSSGTSSQLNGGLTVNYLAGYTGSNITQAFQASNNAASTGNNLSLGGSTSSAIGNIGNTSFSYGTTTGLNVGGFYSAEMGNNNIGLIGKATVNKTSAQNIGIIGVANNTGTTPGAVIGGFFGLMATTPTFATSALMADNGAIAADIFVARDNGTAKFTIADGGSINSAISQTTYNGATSGTAVWSMPFQGSSYKKFVLYYNALVDAGGTISFPTAFTHTPYCYGDTAAAGISSATTTTFTIAAAATITGNEFCEGF